MFKTKNRKFKVLGAGWLGMGIPFLALAFIAFLSVILGDDPATAAFESGDKWWIVVLVLSMLGAIPTFAGLALLRRSPAARPLIATAALVLLIPSAISVIAGFGVLMLMVVVPSLWFTLSGGGKEAFEGYMARETG